MPQSIPFLPSDSEQFTIYPELDGKQYTAIVYTNGKRCWVRLIDFSGKVVANRPIAASPDTYNVNIHGLSNVLSKFIYRRTSNSFDIDVVRDVFIIKRPSNLTGIIIDDTISDVIAIDDTVSSTVIFDRS
jgi:hypothetical protein